MFSKKNNGIISANEEGVCGACINHGKRTLIDWDKRYQIDSPRCNNNSTHPFVSVDEDSKQNSDGIVFDKLTIIQPSIVRPIYYFVVNGTSINDSEFLEDFFGHPYPFDDVYKQDDYSLTQDISGYQQFHINRISDILMNIRTPYNDHNNGISDAGNFTCKNNEERMDYILTSLFEIGIIDFTTHEEIEQIVLNATKKMR